MQIIDFKTRRGSGHNMHRITVEFAGGGKISAVLYSEPHPDGYTVYISLFAACNIAGVSADAYKKYVARHNLETVYAMIPAEMNGTRQARKMVFTTAADMANFLDGAGEAYEDIRAWFRSVSDSPLYAVIGFDGAMNPFEATQVLLSAVPVRNPVPVAPVHIDFDATGGIEQLNRVVSSLDVPYQIRARALNIQNDFSQLANVIETLNTTGNKEA